MMIIVSGVLMVLRGKVHTRVVARDVGVDPIYPMHGVSRDIVHRLVGTIVG